MINDIRNTVLAVLNKNNYGYISPQDFNLYAQQAQMGLFEDYFYAYNYQINKENQRTSGVDYADIKKGYEEVIDFFSVTRGLTQNFQNIYFTPSTVTTGSDYYLINKVMVYQNVLSEGTTTGSVGAGNKLVDDQASFIGVISVGDIVGLNTSNNYIEYVTVTLVESATELITTGTNLWNQAGLKYSIFKKTSKLEVADQVSHSKIDLLSNSIYTSPTLLFPAYTSEDINLTVFPDTVDAVGQVKSQYIRYPKIPKWTYVDLGTDSEPVFDPSQPDYQDFELFPDDATDLTMKILQYAGVSIREASVVQYAGAAEASETNSEK